MHLRTAVQLLDQAEQRRFLNVSREGMVLRLDAEHGGGLTLAGHVGS